MVLWTLPRLAAQLRYSRLALSLIILSWKSTLVCVLRAGSSGFVIDYGGGYAEQKSYTCRISWLTYLQIDIRSIHDKVTNPTPKINTKIK